ncbi:hypothetical protein [Streptosporangium oxazolinicum]|uniref:hypothetical protein n=1 Tax=Streptosporangium oxazolinicum TaxID=909287 RepID=UPI0031EEDCF9
MRRSLVQPRNRGHSEIVRLNTTAVSGVVARIRGYNSSGESFLSLESPVITYP